MNCDSFSTSTQTLVLVIPMLLWGKLFIICHDLSAKGPNRRWMQQNIVLHKLLVCNCGQCVNLLYWLVLSCLILSDIETNECLENNGGCWQDKAANLTACKVIHLQLVPVRLISIWPYMHGKFDLIIFILYCMMYIWSSYRTHSVGECVNVLSCEE